MNFGPFKLPGAKPTCLYRETGIIQGERPPGLWPLWSSPRVLKLHKNAIYVCQKIHKPNVGRYIDIPYMEHLDFFNWQTFLTDKSTSVMGLLLHACCDFSSVSKFPFFPLNLFPFKASSLRLRRRIWHVTCFFTNHLEPQATSLKWMFD